MRLYFYRGKGVGAALIRWFSRSKYSHVSIAFADGTVYEACAFKGVRKTTLKSTKGVTPYAFKLGVPIDPEAVRIFCEAEIKAGTEYDYWGVICFMLRIKPRRSNSRYFCSEFGMDAVAVGGVGLLERVDSFKVWPDAMSWSPVITVDEALLYKWKYPIPSESRIPS